MFSKLNDKTKAALFYAIGMGLFLIAGCLVYYFPKSQYIDQGTISKTGDATSSIQELYRNLDETGSASQASMVREIDQNNSQFEIKRQTEVDKRWILYVTGCVQNPGVYRLPEEARVFQLVDAAGGLTMVADVVAINMAARLQDGDHLHVPKKGEGDSARNQVTTGEAHGTVTFTQNRQTGNNSTVRSQKSTGNSPKDLRIDLNTASAAELQKLPGIGPSTSERIIQYRNQNGRFKRVSDLINVSGIGAKKLEAIEPFIFVR
jgi:competence protein ComEA